MALGSETSTLILSLTARRCAKKMKSVKDEAAMEMMRMELMEVYREFIKEKCNDKGEQVSNLTSSEYRGLK